jgi:hypothetical protein
MDTCRAERASCKSVSQAADHFRCNRRIKDGIEYKRIPFGISRGDFSLNLPAARRSEVRSPRSEDVNIVWNDLILVFEPRIGGTGQEVTKTLRITKDKLPVFLRAYLCLWVLVVRGGAGHRDTACLRQTQRFHSLSNNCVFAVSLCLGGSKSIFLKSSKLYLVILCVLAPSWFNSKLYY